MTLFDDEYDEEDFAGKVRRTKNGRPYVLANPDWQWSPTDHVYFDPNTGLGEFSGFTDKPAEPRGRSAIYTRVTTYISCLEDTFSLGQHQERGVVIGMASRPSLCARANNIDLTGDERAVKNALNEIAADARDAAGWNEKANLGTAFHDTAELWDTSDDDFRGVLIRRMLPEFRAMLDAYDEATAGWEYAHIEQGMVNDEFRTYGTPDRLRWVRGGDDRFNPEQRGRINLSQEWEDGELFEADPRRVTIPMPKRSKLRVTDIKTGRIDYGWQKMELQLALYALSALYDPDTGIRTELDIDLEYAEIVHVPYGEGTCTVYVVPIAEAVDVLRSLVPRVRAWRSRKPSWVPAGAESLTSGKAAAWPTTPPEAL